MGIKKNVKKRPINVWLFLECKSWFGQKHVKCQLPANSSHDESNVCTIPDLKESNCRSCKDPNKWRCDNGFCISKDKVGNGIPDCLDGSDERSSKSYFPYLHTLQPFSRKSKMKSTLFTKQLPST